LKKLEFRDLEDYEVFKYSYEILRRKSQVEADNEGKSHNNKIKALKFNLTDKNIKEHAVIIDALTSGINVLTDIIHLSKGQFIDCPFVQQIEIACDGPCNHIKSERICDILGIDKSNLCYFNFYRHSFKKSRSYTQELLHYGHPGEIKILVNKKMFEVSRNIFEIRLKIQDEWSSWHGIAGEFIISRNYRFGPGGIVDVYNSMDTNEIAKFVTNYQIRYCGVLLSDLMMPKVLFRVFKDPFNSEIRKIIDPVTFQILFDSQIIQEASSEKSDKLWSDFESRYRAKRIVEVMQLGDDPTEE